MLATMSESELELSPTAGSDVNLLRRVSIE